MLCITLFYNWKICNFWLQHLFCPPPTLIPLVTIILFWVLFTFICYLFIILEFTYKWNHIVFVFLCLTYFSMIPWRSVMSSQKARFYPFLWLSSIPLCIYITYSLGFPGSSAGKAFTCNAGDLVWFLGHKLSWRRGRLLTPVFLGFPGGSDGRESVCNMGDVG